MKKRIRFCLFIMAMCILTTGVTAFAETKTFSFSIKKVNMMEEHGQLLRQIVSKKHM